VHTVKYFSALRSTHRSFPSSLVQLNVVATALTARDLPLRAWPEITLQLDGTCGKQVGSPS
jgi:hypothetical protein